jgi:hypothetical protein
MSPGSQSHPRLRPLALQKGKMYSYLSIKYIFLSVYYPIPDASLKKTQEIHIFKKRERKNTLKRENRHQSQI